MPPMWEDCLPAGVGRFVGVGAETCEGEVVAAARPVPLQRFIRNIPTPRGSRRCPRPSPLAWAGFAQREEARLSASGSPPP
jgi:hypothetical protein